MVPKLGLGVLGKKRSLEQTVTIDFHQLAETLKDYALTCLKMFEADKSDGDHHRNMNTLIY